MATPTPHILYWREAMLEEVDKCLYDEVIV